MIVILMGVSGSGKTTVGRILAERMHCEFADGDDFHPASNVARMRAGIPLQDADRQPWIEAIRQWMQSTHAAGRNAVLACSALREKHRDILLRAEPWVRWVHLQGSRELLAQRLAARVGHFMPATLLDTQIATLEPPDDALVIDIGRPPEVLAGEIAARLGL